MISQNLERRTPPVDVCTFHVKHLPVLNEWRKGHALNECKIEDLPAIGFISYHNDSPVAAAWLRHVEGGFAQIDNLIADPNKYPGKARSACIDALVVKIIDHAKKIGVSAIISNTIDKTILKRAQKHGFRILPHFLMALELQ